MENSTTQLLSEIKFLKDVLNVSNKINEAKTLLSDTSLVYNSISGQKKCINVNDFFTCSSSLTFFDFDLDEIKSFCNIYKISFDKNHPKAKELMSVYNFLKKFDTEITKQNPIYIEFLKRNNLY